MAAPVEQPHKVIKVIKVKSKASSPAGPPYEEDAEGPVLENHKAETAEDVDDLFGEPSEVPPVVVTEKLQELLKKGRSLVLFKESADAGAWGLNGRLDKTWHSFRCDETGSCEYVDESIWQTEAADAWTEEELEQLGALKTQATAKHLQSTVQQPTARLPKTCQRIALETYRQAQQEKKRKELEAQQAEEAAKSSLADKEANAKTALAAASEQEEVRPGDTGSVDQSSNINKEGPISKKPAIEEAPTSLLDVHQFMRTVRERAFQAGEKSAYKTLLHEICSGNGVQALRTHLAGDSDLLLRFGQLASAAGKVHIASTFIPSSASGRKALKAKAKVAKAPPKQPSKASERQRMLKESRSEGKDAASQLVKMMYFGTGTKASLRLQALRYARSCMSKTADSREMYILRGLPGLSKKEWVLKHLRSKVQLDEDKIAEATFVHFCSASDFEAGLDLSDSNSWRAAAANEVRATFLTEIGVSPLYIDGMHLRLHDMAEYVRLGKEAGYDVSIIPPREVSDIAFDGEALASELEKQAKSAGKDCSKLPSKLQLEALLQSYEREPEEGDVLDAILSAKPSALASESIAETGMKRPRTDGLVAENRPVKIVKAPAAIAKKGGAALSPRPPAGPPPPEALLSQRPPPAAAKPVIAKRPPTTEGAKQSIAKRPPGVGSADAPVSIAKRPPSGAISQPTIAKRPPSGPNPAVSIAKRPPGAKPAVSIAKRPPVAKG